MSYLTESEIDALQLTDLSRETPFLIGHVRSTQFSVARHYGGAKYNGWHYMYIPTTDELVRDDVVKWVQRKRRFDALQAKAEAVQEQVDIWGSIE
jgi:hypothetical protein